MLLIVSAREGSFVCLIASDEMLEKILFFHFVTEERKKERNQQSSFGDDTR
jgi:hypothetical protein